ncbi:MAG: hypothetical protein L6R48_11770 [Planctomycetes bacterium]|nr:hypothetical protein [Planctomycetota bacterium]
MATRSDATQARTAAILTRLAERGRASFGDLQELLAPVTARTLSALLRRLEGCGWLEHDRRTRLYHLGAGFLALAQRVVAGSGQERAAALLADLAAATGCSAGWFVLRTDDRAVLAAKHEVAGGHRYTPVGGLKEDFTTHGFGQVMLAVLPGPDRRRLLAAAARPPALPPSAFAVRLDEARRRGWLVERRECDAGVERLAAPVQHNNGLVSAVGVSAPRLPAAREAELAASVAVAARRLVPLGALAAVAADIPEA